MPTACNVELPDPASEIPNGLDILVVEDHADSALSAAKLLRMYGHEVRVAADGPAALAEAHSRQPDVVLLDIGLPGGMDGYELARRLQTQKAEKRPLLVAITGLDGQDDRKQSKEVGIDLHLVKPANMEDLLRILKRLQGFIDR